MYATYFEGDDDVPADNEARDIWLGLGLDPSRVIASNKKDNFWEMGDTGPCGPCSEIHFDRIGGRDASHLVNKDDPNVIEIWNHVFMQYYRNDDGSLSRLPHNHVDTGMGLERITSILQDVRSNYDTDVFIPIFEAIQQGTRTSENPEGVRAYTGKLGSVDEGGVDMAYRVIADHIRTLTFAITDGAVPSAEGRGYVLRRILRRAVRYGDEKLNAPRGFFSKLVPTVVENFKDAFPELVGKASFVQEVIAEEEASFNRTLRKGRERFDKFAAELAASGSKVLPGPAAFFLYDSMGFPLDLTQIMADERGFTVDVPGFRTAMEEQKEKSRAARRAGVGGVLLKLEAEQTADLADKGIAPTDDSGKYEWYIKPSATVKAIFSPKTGFLAPGAHATPEEGPYGVILDATSFYAESGGQEADFGVIAAAVEGSSAAGDASAEDDILTGSPGVFDVQNAQAFAGYVLHMGEVREGKLSVGDSVRVAVDYDRREHVAPNHTMTHVLNYALRKVLGDGIDQKGSLVAADKLRFDFSHNTGLLPEQAREVEEIVNDVISRALPVHNQVVSLAEGRAITSLRAVFGETYPDPVRVVSVGQPVSALISDPTNAAWMDYSIEFCGGTHLRNTSQARRFCLVEESAVAKGIRRAVAVTMEAASDAFDNGEQLESKFAEARSMPWRVFKEHSTKLKDCLDNWTMPVHVKSHCRSELEELERKAYRERKAEADAMILKIADDCIAEASAGAAERLPILRRVEGDAATPKTIANVITKLQKKHKKGEGYAPLFLWFCDDAQFGAALVVPKDSLDAKAWMEAAIAGHEGVVVRAGKDGLSAQVAGKTTESSPKIGDQAQAFASSGSGAAAAASSSS
jgi:alanyl-tRNA synthetase